MFVQELNNNELQFIEEDDKFLPWFSSDGTNERAFGFSSPHRSGDEQEFARLLWPIASIS